MNYILFGKSGKVGKEILLLNEEEKSLCLRSFGRGDVFNIENIKPEVAIDFTSAPAFNEILHFCIDNKIPLVSGTTGLSEKSFIEIEKASKAIPILWASNTSLGVQVFLEMLKPISKIKDWDFHIVEAHHKHKVDAPSGTAISIQKEVSKLVDKLPPCDAVRGGGIFGKHELHIMADEETIKIEHVALSRRLFARGAIKAAKFLKNQKAGLYTMKDVLLNS